MKQLKVVQILIAICVICASLVSAPLISAAYADPCPSPKKDGKTIGEINVGGTKINVKSVTYPLGGEFDPPKSPLNAGVSARHMPLSATEGSSLIVWHINYNGCQGKLNVINNKSIGYKFSVVDEKGKIKNYVVSSRTTVKKGQYKRDWFRLNGPRQLVFVTCTGKVVNSSYTDNLVIIATPTK